MNTLLIVVAVVASACGGSPVKPTPPPPPPILAANIVSLGGGLFSLCNFAGCIFQGPMRNDGAGCANTVRGTVTFNNAQNQPLGTFQWSIAATTVVRPSESFVFTSGLLPAGMSATTTYRVEPAWTNIRC